MQSFNHVAGGFAFTGIFCSFAEVNIFDSFPIMGAVWVASVLPDIDHTKSISGKMVYPLAKWLQTKFGHRTITHSLWFFVAVVAIVKGFDNLFHQHFTLPVALALGSHLIFDMCTKQGIPIFYPFSKRPAVLPANPKLRLSANDFRSEAIIFLIFCCLNVFSYPLMAVGFWTKYNKAFATWDHVEREIKRHPGDYSVTYLRNQRDTVTALLVSHSASEFVFYADRKFLREKPENCKLIEFNRQRTQHRFTTVNLFQVSPDSLNTYLKNAVVRVTAQSPNELYCYDGPIMKRGTELTVDYPADAKFMQMAIDNSQTLAELQLLTAAYVDERKIYAQKMAEIQAIRDELTHERTRTTGNDFDEGERRQRVKVLSEKIAQITYPAEPAEETYKVRKSLLEMKLRETSALNASILIWQVQKTPQN